MSSHETDISRITGIATTIWAAMIVGLVVYLV